MTIELDSTTVEPIHGRLDDGGGIPVEFAGWLELMSALERACARRARSESRASPPEQGTVDR